MDWTFLLTMFICLYPILWIFLGIFLSFTRWKRGYLLGVSLLEKDKEDNDVQVIARHCRCSLLLLSVPFTLVLIPMYFLSYVSVYTFCWMLWVLLAMVVPSLVFRRYYRRLKKLKQTRGWTSDLEERFWLWGMFYYNPEDPKNIVPKRVGVGTTMNMARRPAKALMIFTSACFLSMPLLGVWLMAEDFTPVKVVISGSGVEVKHLKSEFYVAYDDVDSVTLLTEVPTGNRNFGTSLTYLDKGIYEIQGYGSCRVCIDRRDPVFLVLETAEETYLIGFDDRAEAEEVIGAVEL